MKDVSASFHIDPLSHSRAIMTLWRFFAMAD